MLGCAEFEKVDTTKNLKLLTVLNPKSEALQDRYSRRCPSLDI